MGEIATLDTKEWNDFLRNTSAKLKDMSKYLIAGVNTFGFKDIIEHFSNEEGPNGAWPSRSERTNRAYDIKGGSYRSSNKLLQLTGDLRKSFLPSSGNVRRRDRLSVEMYSDPSLIYARTHDYGRGNIPQREFMWLSDKAKDLILTLVMDELTRDNTSPGGSD